jgi:hypothetical protein
MVVDLASEARKPFFSEEKNQKTFFHCLRDAAGHFSKRERLS